jgi:hypothetical protein
MENIGIKETEEALEGILKLGLVMWKTFHDGFQMGDITDLWIAFQEDEEFKETLLNAFEGYKAIPDEIGDISIDEVVALSGVMIKYLPRYLHAIE